jgi:hypothetical protein
MTDLELTCWRFPTVRDTTLGVLVDGGGEFLCFTLEDAVREQRGVPVNVWKIPGKTAIPVGRYRLTLETSPRFGPETLTINGVPGFVGIRVHSGNDDGDTDGCPLLGMTVWADALGDGGDVRESRNAVAKLKGIVGAAIAAGRSAWWIIRGA